MVVACGFAPMMLPFQSELEFQGMINKINAGRPQCPVGLNTLVLPSKGSLNLHEKHPYVYLACGHVHGKHEWGQGDSENRTCPLCMEVGQVVSCCPETKGALCLPEVMERCFASFFKNSFYHNTQNSVCVNILLPSWIDLFVCDSLCVCCGLSLLVNTSMFYKSYMCLISVCCYLLLLVHFCTFYFYAFISVYLFLLLYTSAFYVFAFISVGFLFFVVVLFWLANIFLFSVQTGPFVKLQMGCELSLYVDSECPTYCFNPCGHVASDGTVKYVC